MAGFGMALAGGLAGLGDSIVDQAKQAREERLLAIRRQWDREDDTLANQRAIDRMTMQNQFNIDAETRRNEREDEQVAALGGLYKSMFDASRMDQSALDAMAALESRYESPFRISSTYRDPDTNAAVGGAKGSQHLLGKAFDVDVSHMSTEERQQFIRDARATGFSGIGVYKNSIHLDTGGDRAWGPNYDLDTLPDWAADAVTAPIGTMAGDVDWNAFARAPASVQVDILTGLGVGRPKATGSVSNYEWISNGDGTETKVAYQDGRQVAVTGFDGQPVTRNATDDWSDLKSFQINEIEEDLKDDLGEVDPALANAFSAEVERLMNEEELSFTQAKDKAFQTAEREKITTKEGGFLGFGGTEVTSEGDYTGRFNRQIDEEKAAAPAVGETPRGLAPTGGGEAAIPRFASPEEVKAAVKAGRIKAGDVIILNGQKVRVQSRKAG